MAIDWAEVGARLQKSAQALGEALTHDPQRIAAVFRERAARLAEPHTLPAASAQTPMLVCRLGPERCAIPLADVAEVILNPPRTPLPGSSPRLAGVINVRGETRLVWDLARLLNLGGKESDQAGCVLLVRQKGREAGLWADRAEQVILLQPQEWQQSDARSPCLLGVTSDAVMILKTEALLEEEFC